MPWRGCTGRSCCWRSIRSRSDEASWSSRSPTWLPTWDGSAKVAYQGVQQAWNQLNQTLNEGLDGMGTGVQNAHDTFVQAEQANTNIWGA